MQEIDLQLLSINILWHSFTAYQKVFSLILYNFYNGPVGYRPPVYSVCAVAVLIGPWLWSIHTDEAPLSHLTVHFHHYKWSSLFVSAK